jgi:hypothetical protein
MSQNAAVIAFTNFLVENNVTVIEGLDIIDAVDKNFDKLNEGLLRKLIEKALKQRDVNLERGVPSSELLGSWGLVIDTVKVVTERRREAAATHFQELIEIGRAGNPKNVTTHITKLYRSGGVDYLLKGILNETLDACRKSGGAEHVAMLQYFNDIIDKLERITTARAAQVAAEAAKLAASKTEATDCQNYKPAATSTSEGKLLSTAQLPQKAISQPLPHPQEKATPTHPTANGKQQLVNIISDCRLESSPYVAPETNTTPIQTEKRLEDDSTVNVVSSPMPPASSHTMLADESVTFTSADQAVLTATANAADSPVSDSSESLDYSRGSSSVASTEAKPSTARDPSSQAMAGLSLTGVTLVDSEERYIDCSSTTFSAPETSSASVSVTTSATIFAPVTNLASASASAPSSSSAGIYLPSEGVDSDDEIDEVVERGGVESTNTADAVIQDDDENKEAKDDYDGNLDEHDDEDEGCEESDNDNDDEDNEDEDEVEDNLSDGVAYTNRASSNSIIEISESALIKAGDDLNSMIKSCGGDISVLKSRLNELHALGSLDAAFDRVLRDNIDACRAMGYVNKGKLFEFIRSLVDELHRGSRRNNGKENNSGTNGSSGSQEEEEEEAEYAGGSSAYGSLSSHHAPKFVDSASSSGSSSKGWLAPIYFILAISSVKQQKTKE